MVGNVQYRLLLQAGNLINERRSATQRTSCSMQSVKKRSHCMPWGNTGLYIINTNQKLRSYLSLDISHSNVKASHPEM